MKTRTLACSFFAAVLGGSLPVSAQQPSPARPYRGLFAGGVEGAEQLLAANASLGGGYSNNVFADPLVVGVSGAPSPFTEATGSGYASGNAGLSYVLNRSRLTVGASASSEARYFPDLGDRLITAYSGHAKVSLQVLSSLSVTQDVSYQPWFAFSPFPTLGEPPAGQPLLTGSALAASRDGYLHSLSGVQFTQGISRRSTLALNYSYAVSDFGGVSDDLRTQSGSGLYTHGLTRSLGVRAGYAYSEGRYGRAEGTRRVNSQTIDAGLEFNRPLSLTRRTSLSFATGTSAMNDRNQTYYRFTGQARLNHEIGRTWGAVIAYDRNLSFVESFHEPLFYDAVSGGISGLITRRLQFQSSAGASFGELGLARSNSYDSYHAASSLTHALSRYVGLGVDYSLNWYRFGSERELPPGLSQQMNWQSVRAYVTLWAPLVHSGRRSNASR